MQRNYQEEMESANVSVAAVGVPPTAAVGAWLLQSIDRDVMACLRPEAENRGRDARAPQDEHCENDKPKPNA